MGELSIRQATIDDAPDLADLRASWSAGEDTPADPRFAAEFSDWLAVELPHRRFWIASRVEGETVRPVGMVNLLVFIRMPTAGRSAGAWGYLGNMFVRESERNTGVGAAMLEALLRHADEHDLVRVVLNPSERSRPFYQRHGFAPADDGLLIRPLAG